MDTHPPASTLTLLAATHIAHALNRTPASVIAAVRRMEIQPVLTCGKRNFYDPEVIGKLREGMRKRNGEGPRYAYYISRKATQD